MIRIGIIAGEVSGDLLGAGLVKAIKDQDIDFELVGIGGNNLIGLGCSSLYPMERLSVMGITEISGRFFELLNIQNKIKKYFLANPPDVFIGIDSPDFNFPIEMALHKAGIKTIHYVSPTVWAWREGRLKKIQRSVDLMLALFPFEVPFYEKHNIPVLFVGHPLAEKIDIVTNKKNARDRLNLPADKKMIAIMPGSRNSELDKLIVPFIKTAIWCMNKNNNLHFIIGLTNADVKEKFTCKLKLISPELPITIFIDQSLDVMEAADAILLASGTVALEAMLLKRPMVVAYKLNWFTYQIAKIMIDVPYISLPNLLLEDQIVPECIQEQCTPEIMGKELMRWLENKKSVVKLEQKFTDIHKTMLLPTNKLIANAVLDLIYD